MELDLVGDGAGLCLGGAAQLGQEIEVNRHIRPPTHPRLTPVGTIRVPDTVQALRGLC